MGVPFFQPNFEPVAQANLGLALSASSGGIPLFSPLGFMSFGFLWPGIYDRCNIDPVTGWSPCGSAPVTTWTPC